MLSITQFEVYVYDQGRWTLHARHGSDQRKAAVMDARTTEFTTGLPTKVVVETYFPESGESELVTAYISPKARELREAAKLRRAGRNPAAARPASTPAGTTGRQRGGLRPGASVRQFVLQGIMAAAFSLVAATVSTALISWGLKQSIEAGLKLSPTLSTSILTYTYAVFFFFFFLSLFRSRLPLHRVISYLWAKPAASSEKTEESAKSIAAAIAPKLRPKRAPEAVEAEAARAQQELRVLRGDPEPEVEAVPPPEPAPAPEPQPAAETVGEKEKRARDRKLKEEAEKSAAATADSAEVDTKAPASHAADPLALERAVLRRFISDVARPAVEGTMPNDPVTRRGVSLVIAGAATALAQTARISQQDRDALLAEAITFYGVTAEAATTFVAQLDQLAAAPANQTLVNLGRSALSKHLEGTDVARILAVAIAGWRTPHGQPAGEKPTASALAPHYRETDTYILTDLRIGPAFTMTPEGAPDSAAEAARDAAMGLHNSIVRGVLGDHGGHEIKHTGAGIFARFEHAAAAVAAAVEIQRRFTAAYGPKLAVALVAGSGTLDDPMLTPNLVRQAQTAVAQACDGEILAVSRVQTSAEPTGEDSELDGDEGEALVKISSQPPAEELTPYAPLPVTEFAAPAAAIQTVNFR